MWKFTSKDMRAKVRLANFMATEKGLALVYDNLQEFFTVYKNPKMFGVWNSKDELYQSRDICEIIRKLKLTSKEFKWDATTSYRMVVLDFSNKENK